MAGDGAEPQGRPQAEADAETIERAGFDGLTFEMIEAAVMETARGRWFLREFARRTRAVDLQRIETSLARIEQRLPIAENPVREAETRIVALSVRQRLADLAAALRAKGVDEDACARIEAQAQALVDLARRRKLIDDEAPPEQKPVPRLRALPV